jgi:hypothetical protein
MQDASFSNTAIESMRRKSRSPRPAWCSWSHRLHHHPGIDSRFAVLPQQVVMHAYTMMPLPSAAPPPPYRHDGLIESYQQATTEMKNKANQSTHTSGSTQRGQAIVLIALGFVVLLAFTGLVVDVARVFTTRGELRRAVDAAGLAATAQFRSGAPGQKIHAAKIW